jgi:hypothetical protein
VVTIRTPDQETRLNLALPEVGDAKWTPPEGTLRGIPPPVGGASLAGVALWPWFSLLALAILAADWRYFGRGSTAMVTATPGAAGSATPQPAIGLGLNTPPTEREEQLTR